MNLRTAITTGCPDPPGLTVHEVEDEAQLVWRVEGVGHAHDEGAVLGGRGERAEAGQGQNTLHYRT